MNKVSNQGCLLVPNVISSNSLIVGYCTQGNMDSESNLFADMQEKGLAPVNYTDNILLAEHLRLEIDLRSCWKMALFLTAWCTIA
ncbi:hypothetical protein ACET3Z_001612 [Daucus carota]